MKNDGYLEGVDFSHVPAKYWSEHTKMSYLQRRIIVASIQYYKMNGSPIVDAVYDGISHQLVKMMNENSLEEKKKTQYWYCMHDFDGSTGFYLYSRLNKEDQKYLEHIAALVKNAK